MATQNQLELTLEEFLRRSDDIRVTKVFDTPSGDKIRMISTMISTGSFIITRVGGGDSPLGTVVVNVPPHETVTDTEEFWPELYEIAKKGVTFLAGLIEGGGGGDGKQGDCKPQGNVDVNINVSGGEAKIKNFTVNVNCN